VKSRQNQLLTHSKNPGRKLKMLNCMARYEKKIFSVVGYNTEEFFTFLNSKVAEQK
jgi:hypothetical protein